MFQIHALLTRCFQTQQFNVLLGDFHLSHVAASLDVCLGGSIEHLAENTFRIIKLCEILIFHMLIANFAVVV